MQKTFQNNEERKISALRQKRERQKESNILDNTSHLQKGLFVQTLRYAQNFILGISIIYLR